MNKDEIFEIAIDEIEDDSYHKDVKECKRLINKVDEAQERVEELILELNLFLADKEYISNGSILNSNTINNISHYSFNGDTR